MQLLTLPSLGLFLIYFLCIYFCALVIHEGLHIFAMNILIKKKWFFKVIVKYKIPVAIAVYTDYFNKPFNKLPVKKQKQYFLIAIIPYFLLIPISLMLSCTENTILSLTGITLLLGSLLNIPLEFFYVTDGKI